MHIRERMANIGEETVKIAKQGYYRTNDGGMVTIKRQVENSIDGTVLYTPEELDELVERFQPKAPFDTVLEVKNITTLHAARDLIEEGVGKVLALNFASARHPGGGFLKGALAQEESLARSSALYETLISKPEMYEENNRIKSGLYSDYMIYSPDVPVFRHDMGNLLSKPYPLSFITSPAANVGFIKKARQNIPYSDIHNTMKRRIEKILVLGLHQGYENIVLGAFGCGVFQNESIDVAGYFKELLGKDSNYHNQYKKIVFAVYDASENKNTFKTFKHVLS